ncbi:hypothetical protein ONZ45_g9957 [Pleurotus djamor]|nr:hypothetical protein ONZ45_g9957 [Pleurotus djamor]
MHPRPRGASRSNTPITTANSRDRGAYPDDGSQAIYEMLSSRHRREDISSDVAIAHAIAEDELLDWSQTHRNSPRPPSQASVRSPGTGIGLGYPGRANTPGQIARQRSDSAPQKYQIWRPPSAADVRTVPRAPSRSSMSAAANGRPPDHPQYGSPLRYPSDGSGPPPSASASYNDRRPTSPVVIPQRTSSRVSSRPMNLPGSTATTYPPSRPNSTAPRYERWPVANPASNGTHTNGVSRTGTPAMDMASRPHSRASAAAANAANPRYAPDEVIARRLARAWNVESLQPDIISEAVTRNDTTHYRSVSNPFPPSGLSMSRPMNIPESSPLIEDDLLIDDRDSPPTQTYHNHRQSSRHPSSRPNLLPIPPSPQPSDHASRERSRTRTSTPSVNGTSTPASTNHRPKQMYPLIEDDVDTSRPDVVLLHFRDLFVGSRACPRCGSSMVSQHHHIDLAGYKCPPIALVDFMHASCSSCSAISCRGSCCPEGRAIAIFETLVSFDDAYRAHAQIVDSGCRAVRQEFNDLVAARLTAPSTTEWEKTIIGAMKTLEAFLKPPTEEDDTHQHHPSVKHLFLMSCVPEVLESLLGNRNVSDWVAHSDLYCAVLATLKCMSNSGLTDLLKDPLPKIDQSVGLGCWMRGEGSITWEGEQGGVISKAPPVYEAVKGLERHRRPLLELAGKIKFPATVKKIHALCDGILYLLLQQMMD